MYLRFQFHVLREDLATWTQAGLTGACPVAGFGVGMIDGRVEESGRGWEEMRKGVPRCVGALDFEGKESPVFELQIKSFVPTRHFEIF